MEVIARVLGALGGLPPVLVYLVIGAGAALENIVPPIPADTFVLLGAFLAGSGRADPILVFLCTWVPNVVSALLVYAIARRHGEKVFASRMGRRLLHPQQLAQVSRFYARWGLPAIFVSRFLPALRAVVPVFAGVSQVPFHRVALPVASASALWYGLLVYLGSSAGRNWQQILALFEKLSGFLSWIAVPFILLLVFWWIKSRRRTR